MRKLRRRTSTQPLMRVSSGEAIDRNDCLFHFHIVDDEIGVGLSIAVRYTEETGTRTTLGSIGGHSRYRTDKDDVRDATQPYDGCNTLADGKCYWFSATSISYAQEFWDAHGVAAARLDQPESFWQAFEAIFDKYVPVNLDATHEQCQACSGCGVVMRTTGA